MRTDSQIITLAAMQIEKQQPAVKKEILKLWQGADVLYRNIKVQAKTDALKRWGIRDITEYEKIYQVLSKYNDKVTAKALADIITGRIIDGYMTAAGYAFDQATFATKMEEMTFLCGNMALYFDRFLKMQEEPEICARRCLENDRKLMKRIEKLGFNAKDIICLYNTVLGQVVEVRNEGEECTPNDRFISEYRNDSRLYSAYRDAFETIATKPAFIDTVCTEMNRTAEGNELERIYNSIKIRRERKERGMSLSDISTDILDFNNKNSITGQAAERIRKIKIEAGLECEPSEELKEDTVMEKALGFMIEEFIFQVGCKSIRMKDISQLIYETDISSSEKKKIVNTAFMKLELMGYDTSDSEEDPDEQIHKYISAQIAASYFDLILGKERESLLMLCCRNDKVAKHDVKKGRGTKGANNAYILQLEELKKENEALKKALEKSEKENVSRLKSMKEENKRLQGEVSRTNAYSRKLEEELEEFKAELLEASIEETEEVQTPQICNEEIFLEAVKGRKILVWGAKKEFADKIKNYDEISCIVTDKALRSNITALQLNGYDGVILCTNSASHSMYWDARNTVKAAKLPHLHLRKTDNNISRFWAAGIDLAGRIDAKAETERTK